MPIDLSSVVIRSLGPDDLSSCVELCLDRNWWPERGKWELLLAEADGWGIDAPDGHGLAGSVILTRWAPDRAAIGMMLTATRYARQGLGRALMEKALNEAGEGVAVSLYATDSGRPLYDKLGFKPLRKNASFRGRFHVSSKADNSKKSRAQADAAGTAGNVRLVTEADLPAIIALDRAMYGADRERMLVRLPGFADRFILFEDSQGIAGYAASWRTEPFMHVGPLVAPDDAAVRSLITDLGTHSTVPIRLDLDPDRTELADWVRACGLAISERTVFMTRGDLTPAGKPDHVYSPLSVACA
jgi:GNAT superfamily N-acetyltransferase